MGVTTAPADPALGAEGSREPFAKIYKWQKRSKNEKKRSRETQTLRAGCSKAGQKNFAPPQTPFPGAQDRQNLISWRWSLPAPTDPVWWKSMHAISSYRGNRHRPPATHTHTDRQDRLHYTAPLASAQCNNNKHEFTNDVSGAGTIWFFLQGPEFEVTPLSLSLPYRYL